MRLAQYSKHGEPQDVINIIEKDIPTPGKGEVLIRMEAAPIHLADLYCMLGKERFKENLPATPGFEGVGSIAGLGEGVIGFSIGDRVFPHIASGTWCDFLISPAEGLIYAPEGDAPALSLLPINPPTSYLMLEDFGNLKKGDWVIQNAANSNCGIYLIELAKQRGIKTINVVRRKELVAELKEKGGDIVLVDGPDLSDRVLAETKGIRAKLGVDAVCGMATARIASCLDDGATVLVYGMLTDDPCMLPPDIVFLRNIRLEGFYTIRQFAKRTPQEVRGVYDKLIEFFEDGTLSTKIAGIYPLDKVKEAVVHAGKRGAERDGKIILTMG